MSDQPGMSHDELIAELRSDMAATAREHQAAAQTAATEAAAAEKAHAEAEAEIARLKQAAEEASMPDAQIRAGILAVRQKFAGLFGR